MYTNEGDGPVAIFFSYDPDKKQNIPVVQRVVLSDRAVSHRLKEHALAVEDAVKRANGTVELAVRNQASVDGDYPVREDGTPRRGKILRRPRREGPTMRGWRLLFRC